MTYVGKMITSIKILVILVHKSDTLYRIYAHDEYGDEEMMCSNDLPLQKCNFHFKAQNHSRKLWCLVQMVDFHFNFHSN
jgi:hypothetical protein